MTLDESASLSPEQLRVAVAERLGWKWARYTLHSDPDYRLWKTIPNHAWILETPATKPTAKVALENTPSYPESRDACATFEATLTGKRRRKYIYFLREIHGAKVGNLDSLIAANDELAFSEATQRCRAFLAVSENRNE